MDKLFKGKKIVVMGLGLHGGGVGAAKFLCSQGADVLITDLKTEDQLAESLKKLKGKKIKYVLGKHREEDFLAADLIVKNPDVPQSSPYLKIAKDAGVPVKSDIGLFMELSDAYIIGVTGTKGKSTTASLIFHLLKAKYKDVFLAGNIGISPLELLPKMPKNSKVVLELSSFALEGLQKSPDIAVVTNIMPDHLNRYGTMADYINAKKAIFKHQKADNILALNKQDPLSEEFAKEAKSKVYFFNNGSEQGIDTTHFKLHGKHNAANLSAAVLVAKLMDVDNAIIEKSLASFEGVPNRQELVMSVNNVKYFNDTTATMPDAACAAIDAIAARFPESRIILIAGGQDKNLGYGELARLIKEKVSLVIMLPGTASDKINKELVGWDNVVRVQSMHDAVAMAADAAKSGDIVLMSPAAASFNIFKNEFDRGDQFVKAVKKIGK